MIKIRNKFNIGDVVYVAKLSDKDKSRYKVSHITSYVDEDLNATIRYGITTLDGSFNHALIECFFLDDDLFWTYGECINRKKSGVIKSTSSHLKCVVLRLFYLILMSLCILPFLAIQLIHWLVTGRKESRTYLLMSELTDKIG